MAEIFKEYKGYTLSVSIEYPVTGDIVEIIACSPTAIPGKQAYLQINEPLPKTPQKIYFDEGACLTHRIEITETMKGRYVLTVARYSGSGMIQIPYWINEQPAGTPTPTPTPGPTPAPGPVIADCTFPAFTPNLWTYFGGLAQWIGCMIKNIITLIQIIVDWIAHFPDHLTAWIFSLFGFDPSKNFWEQLRSDLDEMLSARLGVDRDKPLLDELVKKMLGWLFAELNAAAENGIERLK